MYEGAIQDLIDELGRLPGIGPKSAQRIAFHIIQSERVDVSRLVDVLRTVKERVKFCIECGNISEEDLCRSLHDSFVIVDEAQSLERGVLLTVLSRIGQGSRVILTHDIAQRDNLRVGRHDGVVAVVESLKGHPLFAHVTLTRSERSPIAALVTEMLEEPINFLA